MRFRRSFSPPPYLNRRDQMRMLVLVGLLAGVLLAMNAVARPQMWAWMFAGENAVATEKTPSRPSNRNVDFSVRFDDAVPLAEDEFRSLAATGGEADDRRSPGSADDANPQRLTPAAAGSGRSNEVAISADVLDGIRDDYVGLRASEADAYFHVLARARDLEQRAMERASRGGVDFAVLMDDPDRFRGRPVTVEGELKGLTPIPVEENAYAVVTLWEAWLFNRNSWPNPWCVRCLEIPQGIPQGSRISQPVRVRVTGYFFKKYGYASEGGFHKAPLLLAKQIEWLRTEPQAATPLPGLGPYLLGLAILIAAGLGVMVWRFRVRDRRFEAMHLRRLTTAPRESIEALNDLETTDVSDVLRRLAEDESSRTAAAADTKAPGHTAPGA